MVLVVAHSSTGLVMRSIWYSQPPLTYKRVESNIYLGGMEPNTLLQTLHLCFHAEPPSYIVDEASSIMSELGVVAQKFLTRVERFGEIAGKIRQGLEGRLDLGSIIRKPRSCLVLFLDVTEYAV